MKKKLLLIATLVLMLVPTLVFAKEDFLEDYNTKNLKETLKEEEIELKYKGYKENKKQIPIYVFRGSGCQYCNGFLNFLNDNAEEYGKYFKLVSFEVWSDAKNADLLTEVSEFLEQPAGGVPYIIIGNQVFPGYAKEYEDAIKKAIKDEYDSKNKYDVFEELEVKRAADKRKEQLPIILAVIAISCSIIVPVVCTVVVVNTVKRENNKVVAYVMESEDNIKTAASKLVKDTKIEKEPKEAKENSKKKKA